MQEDVNVSIERLRIELKAKVVGYTLSAIAPEPQRWDPLSLACAGREVFLEIEGEGSPLHRLALLWGIAIPLGWIPWDRWPLWTPTSTIFHHFGPWSCIADHLAGSGRGEEVWPSVCAAAQCEAGVWEGDHPQERRIQALMHRLLYNPGPVDGVLGPQTLGVLRTLGLGKMSLKDALAALERKQPITPMGKNASQGKIQLGEVPHQIHTFGKVMARKDGKGASITVRGAGRIVIDLWP